MDLQTRKLNLITYLAKIQDESFLEKIESLILKREKSRKGDALKVFSENELIKRAEESGADYKAGKITSQDDLEKLSASW
ncbi:MAG: hypothetical protein ACXWDO_02280 [Bacteroidia bacterium]